MEPGEPPQQPEQDPAEPAHAEHGAGPGAGTGTATADAEGGTTPAHAESAPSRVAVETRAPLHPAETPALAAATLVAGGGWTAGPTAFAVFMGAVFGYAMVAMSSGLFSDESFHGPQIWHMYTGHWEMLPSITMFPTYHVVLALIAKGLSAYHDNLHRLVTALVSLSLHVLAYRMVRRLSPAEAGRRTLQGLFFAIVFPYAFLMYTDVWSMASVVGVLLLAISGRNKLAGLASALAILIRQDAVVWVGLAWLVVSVEGVASAGFKEGARKLVRQAFARGWPYLVCMAAFLVFVWWNGGVAIGDKKAHPGGYNVANIWSMLIWSWVLVLPLNVQAVPGIFRLAWRRPWVVLVAVALGLLFYRTYANPHPYNQGHLINFLHNRLLHMLTNDPVAKAVGCAMIVWMVLTWMATPLAQARLAWVYPVGAVAVTLHPLVEPRYYIPPLLLLLYFRKPLSPRWENTALVYGTLLTVGIMWGCMTKRFFL